MIDTGTSESVNETSHLHGLYATMLSCRAEADAPLPDAAGSASAEARAAYSPA